MRHSDYISSLIERGQKSEYAKKLGVSISFLSQIKKGTSKTPISIYDRVIDASNGEVTMADLLAERMANKASEKA